MDERHQAHLAQLEAALLALVREGTSTPNGHDAVRVNAFTTFEGHVDIDVEYIRSGVPCAGESL